MIMSTVLVATAAQSTSHVEWTAIIQAQMYMRAFMKVLDESTSPWRCSYGMLVVTAGSNTSYVDRNEERGGAG